MINCLVGVVQLEGDEGKIKSAISAVVITICGCSDILFPCCDSQEQCKCSFLMVVSFKRHH
jgi:hypothetical protein